MALIPTSAWINPQNEAFSVAQDTSQSFSASELTSDDVGLNGSVVQLKSINNPTRGTITQSAPGQYVYTPNAGYVGTDSFTYVVTDQNGVNVCTETVSVTVTASKPGPDGNVLPPVIVRLLDDAGASQGQVNSGGNTDDTTPTLQGSAEPGSKIVVYDKGLKIGEAVTGADWQWTFTPTTPLANGPHTFSVVSSRPDGSGATTAPHTYDCIIGPDGSGNTTPVLPPVITSLNDDVGASQGVVPSGGTTDDTIPVLKGTGEPGSVVTLYDNGVKIGTAPVGPDWQWTFTPPTALGSGTHNFTAVGSRPDGSGTTPAIYPYSCVIGPDGGGNTAPVLPPVITSLNDDVGASQGVVPSGGTTDDTIPVLKGTGEPGSVVTLYDNGVKIGTAPVGADWQWTFTPPTALGSGTHNFTAVGSRPDGSGTTPAVYPYSCVINTGGGGGGTPVGTPIITGLNDDVGATQGPVNNGGSTDDSTPTIKGTGEPGTKITVYDNGVLLGTTTVGADYLWTLTPATALPAGAHNFTAVGSRPDGSGAVNAPYPYGCTIITAPPVNPVLAPIITTAVDDVGPSQGPVGNGGTTDDTQPAIQGTGEPGTKVTVYDNGNKIGEATVGPDWLWSLTPSTPLGNGSHNITAVGSRPDGSGATNAPYPYALTVASGGGGGGGTPAAPAVVITEDVNNDGTITSTELNNRIDVQVTVSAAAKVGDVVTVTDQAGNKITRALTSAEVLSRTVTLPDAFPVPANGQIITVSATLTDSASGLTSTSGTDSATMSTGTPATGAPTIVITTDANNDGVIGKPEYAGRIDVQVGLPAGAKAGDQLTVTDNAGNVAGRVLTPADVAAGTVTLSSAFATPPDSQTVTVSARIINAAGQSSASGTDSATVDVTAPTAPGVIITTDDDNSGRISKTELDAHQGIDVKVPLAADARAGDTLTVTDQAGRTVTKVLTPADIGARAVTFDNAFPAPADGQTVTVRAKLTDPAGNGSPEATDSAVINTSAPAIGVTIVNDRDNNGTITRAELADATRVDVRTDLPTAAQVGDRVDVSDQTGVTLSKVLTAADLAARSVYFPSAFGLPPSGGTVAVTAKITDTAGNVSPIATDTAVFDGNYPPAAVNDANSVKGYAPNGMQQQGTTATGNVLTNDTDPDGPVSALRVAGVSALMTGAQPGTGVGTVIEGRYGHLTLNADGSYNYVSDRSAGLVSTAEDVFYYINKDASGALSPNPAKLAIRIEPPFAQVTGISSPTATEGSTLDFIVTTTGTQVTTPLTLSLQSGTGTAGVDTGTPLQVNFGGGWIPLAGNNVDLPPGTTSFQVRVPTVDDQLIEPTETVLLSISSPMTTNILTGTGTIVDNDALNGGSRVTGIEDTPLPLKWADFGLQNLPNAAPSLVISSLPADGVLQYNNGGGWVPATVGQTISKADVDSGRLRFMPDANESGIDGFNRPGIGNLKNDYAQAGFTATDAAGNRFNGTLTIDIAPVADGTAKISGNVMSANGGGFPAGYTGDSNIYTTADGRQTTAADPNGYQGYWEHVTLTGSSSSPDRDGSEKLMYKLHVNQYDAPNALTLVMLKDGTVLHPDANGDFWVPGTETTVYEFRQVGKGPNGSYSSHQTVTATAYIQELSSDGKVLSEIKGNTVTSGNNTPLVLDLNGDGVHTVDARHGVQFDFTGAGADPALRSGWVDRHDGLLVLDRSGNGLIDNGTELFGDATRLADGTTAMDGFQALADLDTNHDGKISSADDFFAQLQVWVDANGDGVTQTGELSGLADLGITELSLEAAASTATNEGNTLGLVSSYTTADGASHAMADVWFASTSQTAVTAGLDCSGHDLDTLLAHAGLPQASTTAATTAVGAAKNAEAEGHGQHHHAGHTIAAGTVVAHHEWAH